MQVLAAVAKNLQPYSGDYFKRSMGRNFKRKYWLRLTKRLTAFKSRLVQREQIAMKNEMDLKFSNVKNKID